jgi:hypothetical protein
LNSSLLFLGAAAISPSRHRSAQAIFGHCDMASPSSKQHFHRRLGLLHWHCNRRWFKLDVSIAAGTIRLSTNKQGVQAMPGQTDWRLAF